MARATAFPGPVPRRANGRLVLGLVALTACSVPARRAARIDPLIALNDQ